MNISAFFRKIHPVEKYALITLLWLTSAWQALAQNVYEGWDKAPTFTPPHGCIPTIQNYGVTARCEKTLEPGRRFFVLIDAALGWSRPTKEAAEAFTKDHVREIKQHWEELVQNNYPDSKLTFSSRDSTQIPGNTPRELTTCQEYSIGLEIEEKIDGKNVPVQWRVEGLTCGWAIKHIKKNAKINANIELFWLEIFDTHSKALGQGPTPRLESIIRDVFASARV